MSQELSTTSQDFWKQQLVGAICANDVQRVVTIVGKLRGLGVEEQTSVLTRGLTAASALYEGVCDPLHPVSERISVNIRRDSKKEAATYEITAEATCVIGLCVLNELLQVTPIGVKRIVEISLWIIETFRYDRLPMEISVTENPLMVVMKNLLSSEKPGQIPVKVYLAQLFLAEKFSALGFARGIADKLLQSSSKSKLLFDYLQGLQVIPATQPYYRVQNVMSSLIAVVRKGKDQDKPPFSKKVYLAQMLDKADNLPISPDVAGIIISYLFTPKRLPADRKLDVPDIKGSTSPPPPHTDDTEIDRENTGIARRL